MLTHAARDASFYTWPPAIRLFHPFVPRDNLTDAATDIADLIQKLNISSFDITLDQILILPHFELLEEMEDRAALLPTQHEHRRSISADASSHRRSYRTYTEEDRELGDIDEVQQLIRKEELKGMKKLQQRLEKAKKQGQTIETEMPQRIRAQQSSLSPREVMRQQKERMLQFNGPCVVCLEPNEDSQVRLHAIRRELLTHIFSDYDGFSVSSSVSPKSVSLPRHVVNKHLTHKRQSKDMNDTALYTPASFRPSLVLGSFSSVNKAIQFAKKLQRLWEPLTFHVSDLHVISRTTPSDSSSSSSSSSIDNISHDSVLEKDNDIFTALGEYGCDAMIMLNGEEWQLMGNNTGTNSGYYDSWKSYSKNLINNESSGDDRWEEEDTLLMDFTNDPWDRDRDSVDDREIRDSNRYYEQEYVQEWLNDDEDLDDGATIIVGRTQFFMGEMRKYVGMPAYSPMDGKDRILGDGVSALDRRKAAINRKAERWTTIDYGEQMDEL